MARRAVVDLFCEDRGHELLVEALLRRLSQELGVQVSLRTRSARGGHGRAVAEFKAWQRAVSNGLTTDSGDLLVLVIDANCKKWTDAYTDLEKQIDRQLFPSWAVGCPDPHVERWCLADPVAFREVVGVDAPADPGKCDRGLYKQRLSEVIDASQEPVLGDPMQLAPDLIEKMDLYRSGRRQRSFRLFVEALRKSLQSLASRGPQPGQPGPSPAAGRATPPAD